MQLKATHCYDDVMLYETTHLQVAEVPSNGGRSCMSAVSSIHLGPMTLPGSLVIG